MLSSFYWVLKNEIAGMALPTAAYSHPAVLNAEAARNEAIEEEINQLRHLRIGGLVTLTENPLYSAPFEKAGIAYLHIPIPDMTAPSLEQIQHFVSFSQKTVESKKAVVAHCLGGSGRTGTMLACYLVSKGRTPNQAIEEVRRARPFAIETMQQEGAIIEYAMLRKHQS
jgi:atypical dual specificity phosphatase